MPNISNKTLRKQIALLEERKRQREENFRLKRKLLRLKNPAFAKVADKTGSLGMKLAKRLKENAPRIRNEGIGL